MEGRRSSAASEAGLQRAPARDSHREAGACARRAAAVVEEPGEGHHCAARTGAEKAGGRHRGAGRAGAAGAALGYSATDATGSTSGPSAG